MQNMQSKAFTAFVSLSRLTHSDMGMADSLTQPFPCIPNWLIPIDGAGGKTTFSILSLVILPPPLPHTPLSLSLSSLSLSHTASASRSHWQHQQWGTRLCFHTQPRVEAALANTQKRTHSRAQEENGRWIETPAVACPLAAVRHVGGGGALLAVPCQLQSSKHLPSPQTLAPWLCSCWGAGWNDPGEQKTQGLVLNGTAGWKDYLILYPPPLQADKYKADLWSAPQMHAHIGGHGCVDQGSSTSTATERRRTTETRR